MPISIRLRKSWYNLSDVNHAEFFKRIEGRVNDTNAPLPISESFMSLLCPGIVQVSEVLNSLQLIILRASLYLGGQLLTAVSRTVLLCI
jgi:hypothetical protein